MTPLERTLIAHEGNPSPLLEEGRAYHSTAILATQPIGTPCCQLLPMYEAGSPLAPFLGREHVTTFSAHA